MSEQTANVSSSTLGYTLAIPLVYVKSGMGHIITTNIKQLGINSTFPGLVITVDKYLVTYTAGYLGTSFDGPEAGTLFTTFDVAINNLGYFSTLFDSTELQTVEQFIKFPPGDVI
jgi:hypothetical protein